MSKSSQWLFEAPFNHTVLELEWGQINHLYGSRLGKEEWETASHSTDQVLYRETIRGFPRYKNLAKLLPKREQDKINQLAQIVVKSFSSVRPIHTIQLIGHADIDTPRQPSFEKKISGERALEVQKALVNAINNLSRSSKRPPGTSSFSSRINWQRVAVGASQLAVPNPKTETDRLQNRRVEIVLLLTAKPSIQPHQSSCANACQIDLLRCLESPSSRQGCHGRHKTCLRDCAGRSR